MTYKIAISKENYNVLSESNPNNLIFSSDFNTLKYYASGSRTVNISAGEGEAYLGYEVITHGLGYNPFFIAYVKDSDIMTNYQPVGIYFSDDPNGHRWYFVYSTTTKLIFCVLGVAPSDSGDALQNFINIYDGEYVSLLSPGRQCFDLVVAWTDLLNIPHYPGNPSPFPYANAYQIYTDFGSFQATYFDKIAYSGNSPSAGDIVVWSNDYYSGGHTGVATGALVGSFDCFVQNDPTNSACHTKNYNYNHVLGWLRPKNYSSGGGGGHSVNFTATFNYKIFKNNLGL
jgi:hypothetical protein